MNNSFRTEYLEIEQHSVLRSIYLHFLPGVLILIFYIFSTPYVMRMGYPSTYALLLAELLVLAPYGLGHLFYHGKKKHGKFTLKDIVLFRERIAIKQYIVIVPIAIILSFGIYIILSPFDQFLRETIFVWLPQWYFTIDFSPYSKSILIMMFSLAIVIDGVVGPLIEELYFRGYLLPRLARLGILAPLMNAFLFAIYHFWQPMNYPSLILISFVFTYIAWWKRNIYLSIFAHCGLNMLGHILGLMMIVSK